MRCWPPSNRSPPDQRGSAQLEPVGEGPSSLFDDPLALAGLSAAAAVTQGALPEREPHPGAFLAFEALLSAFSHPDVWPAVFVRSAWRLPLA